MRELSIADLRQLTEGEKTWEHRIFGISVIYAYSLPPALRLPRQREAKVGASPPTAESAPGKGGGGHDPALHNGLVFRDVFTRVDCRGVWKYFIESVTTAGGFASYRVEGLPIKEKGGKDMDDQQILELYFCRDQQAIAETEQAYGPYCRKVAGTILVDDRDTEETVSDTWLHTWNTIPPQRPTHFRQFLAKVTRNLALSRWRRQTAQKRGGGQVELALAELEECVSGGTNAEDYVNYKELKTTIDRFLRQQPSREQALFLERYFYLRPIQELADRHGLKEANVLQILSRTRKKLRSVLEQEGYTL